MSEWDSSESDSHSGSQMVVRRGTERRRQRPGAQGAWGQVGSAREGMGRKRAPGSSKSRLQSSLLLGKDLLAFCHLPSRFISRASQPRGEAAYLPAPRFLSAASSHPPDAADSAPGKALPPLLPRPLMSGWSRRVAPGSLQPRGLRIIRWSSGPAEAGARTQDRAAVPPAAASLAPS